MVTLEKIRPELFSNLYESFLIEDDPDYSDEQAWRNVFDYQFDRLEDHCGYALLDNGRVVGMIGMVFSERKIDGVNRKFCNLHTWWVREDHRGRSLALLRPIMKLEDYTLTHFTPCDTVRAVTKRLGFKELNSQLKILMPALWGSLTPTQTQLTFDAQAIAAELAEPNRKILTDHLPYGCGHALVAEQRQQCYLLYTYVVRHRFPYCHIHYISNREIYAKHEMDIRTALIRKHKARFVAVDTRLVNGLRFRRSFNFWAPAHGLYKSTEVQPHNIDHLYSDVVFLSLTTLPDISHEFREIARRWLPRSKS